MADTPETPPAPPPEPGEPEPESPEVPGSTPGAPRDRDTELRDLRKALEAERRNRTATERRLRELEEQTQSESERAVTKARAEGRQEALQAAGVRLAAAEFRVQATGRLADPGAALDVLDLARFVDEDGEVNTDGIAAAVEKLSAVTPAAPPENGGRPRAPRVAPGVQPEPQDTDWLRTAISGR